MVITHYGDGVFRVQSGETSLLLDPVGNRMKADVILRTLVSTKPGEVAENEFSFPGEYERMGIGIRGIAIKNESTATYLKTAYLVNWEDVRFLFLGHLSGAPTTELLELVDEPDVVILPAGGGHFLSAADAAKFVKEIEPAVAIPSFVKNPQEFLKAMGQKGEPQEKLVFKKKDLVKGQSKAVVLEESK